MNNDNCIVDIYLDGNKVTSVDLYSAIKMNATCIYTSGELDYGTHTIKIVNTNTKNDSSADTYMSFDYFKVYTEKNESSAVNPTKLSTTDMFGAYVQTGGVASADKHDLRVVLIANLAKLSAVRSATVTITFTLSDGSVKTVIKTLAAESSDYTLYRTVSAGDDSYAADSGCVLFGNIITDIPNGAYTGVQITITETDTNTVLLNVAA